MYFRELLNHFFTKSFLLSLSFIIYYFINGVTMLLDWQCQDILNLDEECHPVFSLQPFLRYPQEDYHKAHLYMIEKTGQGKDFKHKKFW